MITHYLQLTKDELFELLLYYVRHGTYMSTNVYPKDQNMSEILTDIYEMANLVIGNKYVTEDQKSCEIIKKKVKSVNTKTINKLGKNTI